jgi:hypothetical protein
MRFLTIPPLVGIRVMAVWSVVLALLAIAHMLVLSAASEVGQLQLAIPFWVVFFLNGLFMAGFTASGFGLWRRLWWGRLLFLGLIVTWSLFNFAGLVSQVNTSMVSPRLLLDLLRFGIALVVPLIYLNLPNIRHQFSNNNLSEDKSADDNTI